MEKSWGFTSSHPAWSSVQRGAAAGSGWAGEAPLALRGCDWELLGELGERCAEGWERGVVGEGRGGRAGASPENLWPGGRRKRRKGRKARSWLGAPAGCSRPAPAAPLCRAGYRKAEEGAVSVPG